MAKGRHGKHHRKDGGETPMVAAGNPNVIKEAEKDSEGGSRKFGGRTKRKDGGKIARMHGGGVGLRLDRPGRKRGGGVGSDKSPLSSAHKGSSATPGEPSSADTYGGMPED